MTVIVMTVSINFYVLLELNIQSKDVNTNGARNLKSIIDVAKDQLLSLAQLINRREKQQIRPC